jgi:carboxyl-terminal processing protease
VARWLGPDGKQIPLEGIVPDVEATTTEEQIKARKDVQMDKAVELLKGM